jgi:vacuolar-type H+-ATPase subunit I/STV1
VDVATLVPAGGIAGVLALVIFYLLNSNRQDRIEHRKEREELTAAAAKQREEYRAELATLRTEHGARLDRLRERLDQVDRALDDERKLRIAAETTAASERLRATAAEHQLMLVRLQGDHGDQRGT